MRAVRLERVGAPLRLEEVPLPEPTGTEVRVSVAGAGVCHTDLHIADGIQRRVVLPLTLGHEVAGHVDAAGAEAIPLLRRMRIGSGQPVLVFGGWGCGVCGDCVGGAEQRCETSRAPGVQVDGGYADAMLVPHPRHLVRLREVDPVRAAPLADAGVTPFRAVRRAEPWLVPGARVLVIGAGALGQFALQLLRLVVPRGRELLVAVRELEPARLERATALGADIGLLAVEPAATVAALGGRAAVVLDCVGSDDSLAHAADVVAPGGLIVVVGEAGGELRFAIDRLAPESSITCVAWGSLEDLRTVVRLAERGRLDWTVETMPLERAATAHERLRSGSVDGRIVLVP